MRIDLSYAPPAASETNRSNAHNAVLTDSSPASPALNSGLEEDQARVSGAHTQVQALATLASQLPEVRHERVQTLRQAVASGQYQVSPDEVAGALLAHLTTQRAA